MKKEHPNCKVVFIGPCAAKKLEASRRTIRSDVDFVLTFEEVMGMFRGQGHQLRRQWPGGPELVSTAHRPTAAGLRFPAAWPSAVVNVIQQRWTRTAR